VLGDVLQQAPVLELPIRRIGFSSLHLIVRNERRKQRTLNQLQDLEMAVKDILPEKEINRLKQTRAHEFKQTKTN
jgi:hypothetical protein